MGYGPEFDFATGWTLGCRQSFHFFLWRAIFYDFFVTFPRKKDTCTQGALQHCRVFAFWAVCDVFPRVFPGKSATGFGVCLFSQGKTHSSKKQDAMPNCTMHAKSDAKVHDKVHASAYLIIALLASVSTHPRMFSRTQVQDSLAYTVRGLWLSDGKSTSLVKPGDFFRKIHHQEEKDRTPSTCTWKI